MSMESKTHLTHKSIFPSTSTLCFAIQEQIYVRGMLLDVKKLLTVINFADYIFQLYTYLPTKRNAEMFISNIKVYGEVKSV